MGNSSTTRASSRAPVVPDTNIYPHSSLFELNPYISYVPAESFMSPGPSNNLNAVVPVPVAPTNSQNLSVSPILAPGPPTISPVTPIVLRTPEMMHPLDSSIAVAPVESPNPMVTAVRISARTPENSTVRITSPTTTPQIIRHTPENSKLIQSPEAQTARRISETPSTQITSQNREHSQVPRTSKASAVPFSFQTPEIYEDHHTPELNQDHHIPDLLLIPSPPKTPEVEKYRYTPDLLPIPLPPKTSEVEKYRYTPDLLPIPSPPKSPEVEKDHRTPEIRTVRSPPETPTSHKVRHTPEIQTVRSPPETPTSYKVRHTPEIQTVRSPPKTPTSHKVRHTPEIQTVRSPPETPTSHKVRHTPEIPVSQRTPHLHIDSSTPEVPLISFSPDIPLILTDADGNAFPVSSPDITAVSPTAALRATPSRSPTPTKAVISPIKTHPPPPVTHDISTSPRLSIKSKASVKSPVRQSKIVIEKRPPSKKPTPPPKSTNEPTKSFVRKTSSIDQWDEKNNIDKKPSEIPKEPTYTKQRTQSITKSITSSFSKHTDIERKASPAIQSVVAVPSYSLRATAVYNIPEEEQLLTETTQSIHGDVCIFKYYATAREVKPPTGNHSKATMFQMNTQQKQTPLPTPSLLFLTKNFTDGNQKTNDNLTMGPTFESLGLQNEFVEEYASNPRLKEIKQQKRKLLRSSVIENDRLENSDFVQFVSSTVMSQSNLQTTDQSSVPTSEKFEKNNLENCTTDKQPNSSLKSPRSKASQSIGRSETIVHRKKIEIVKIT